MKIIYLTDIHDALKELKQVFLHTTADLYVLSGDIIYKAFFSEERIIDFCTVQDDLIQAIKKHKSDYSLAYDFATYILRYPEKFNDELIQKATDYRALFNKAAKTMKEKYLLIEELVKKYSHSQCIFLPGNYDIDLQYTALIDRDIHRKVVIVDNLKFAGYGGAPITTPGIPEKLAVKFHEYNRKGMNYSEPEDFFLSELPDILVIHNPAFGFFDRVSRYGSVGSQGIRNYVDEYPPLLVLSGHVHEDYGIARKNGTIFLNSSNFGPVDSMTGYQEGGYMAEIIIEERLVTQVTFQKLYTDKVVDLVKVNTVGKTFELIYENPNSPISAEQFIRG